MLCILSCKAATTVISTDARMWLPWKLIWMFWALLIGLMESAFMPSYLEHHYPEKVLVRESIEWILTARLLFLPVFFVPTLTPPRPR